MDVDQLRSFDRIIRDGSFTKAAARLNVTQATISARIRTLEDQVGGPLLTRAQRNHPMTTTALGDRVLRAWGRWSRAAEPADTSVW